MAEIHPHDALLAHLNEGSFPSQKHHGMWGGCDWTFIDADPEALVLEVVAEERPHDAAARIARATARSAAGRFPTAVIRTWSRHSGSDEDPLLQEFPSVPGEATTDDALLELRAACAANGWERGTRAKARPTPGEAHRVVHVVSAPPPLPKPAAEMSVDEIRAWARAWAKRIVAAIEAQEGGRG